MRELLAEESNPPTTTVASWRGDAVPETPDLDDVLPGVVADEGWGGVVGAVARDGGPPRRRSPPAPVGAITTIVSPFPESAASSLLSAPVAIVGMPMTFACVSLTSFMTSAATLFTLARSACALAFASPPAKGFDAVTVADAVTCVTSTGTLADSLAIDAT